MNTINFKRSLTLALISASAIPAILQAGEWELSGASTWDSKYVSEGRDNLEKGGILSNEMTLADETTEVGIWYGEADSTDYAEWNIGVSKLLDIGSMSYVLNYTHLFFTEDHSDDAEISIVANFPNFANFASSFAAVYSKEADGLFFELALDRAYRFNDRLYAYPYGVLSVNSGYVSDEPEGFNNFQTGATVAYEINRFLTISANANLSFGIADGVDDVAWVGIRLEYSGFLSQNR